MLWGVPVIVKSEDGSFYPRMEDIKKNVSSYTKAIIVNSPNNPSGAIYSEAFIAELVEFCEKRASGSSPTTSTTSSSSTARRGRTPTSLRTRILRIRT